jgi:hypothetical protein
MPKSIDYSMDVGTNSPLHGMTYKLYPLNLIKINTGFDRGMLDRLVEAMPPEAMHKWIVVECFLKQASLIEKPFDCENRTCLGRPNQPKIVAD